MTKVIADQQKLDIPFVQPFAKTAIWAWIAIGIIESLSRSVEPRKKGTKGTAPLAGVLRAFTNQQRKKSRQQDMVSGNTDDN